MSRLILQTNVKLKSTQKFSVGRSFKVIDDLYYISELQAKRFANKWNADYLQITDCNYLPDKHPTFQRFKMYELNYDQILYLDMDAIIFPTCPDIFSLFKGHHLSAVRNNRWDKLDVKIQQRRSDDIKLLDASSDYRPFCAGVMLISKEFLDKTRDSWRSYLYKFDNHEHDQTMMNKLIVEHFDGKYNELDEKWGAWYRKGLYIDHLGGPLRKINFDKRKYMLSNGIYDVIPTSFQDIMT
jgi:hypothetical protein